MVDFSFIVSLYVSDLPNVTIVRYEYKSTILPYSIHKRIHEYKSYHQGEVPSATSTNHQSPLQCLSSSQTFANCKDYHHTYDPLFAEYLQLWYKVLAALHGTS